MQVWGNPIWFHFVHSTIITTTVYVARGIYIFRFRGVCSPTRPLGGTDVVDLAAGVSVAAPAHQ